MDAFSYLSVLLSIIVGLAITQVLQGYRAMLLSRSRVKLYAPPLIWSVLLLLMATQGWWASFGLVTHRDWTFAAFSVILLQMIFLYMIAGVVLPDIVPGEPVDLRVHYRGEITPLFTLLLAMLATSILKEWVLDSRLPTGGNLAFHGAFMVLAVIALAVRHPRMHEALAVLTAVLIGSYIALLFATL